MTEYQEKLLKTFKVFDQFCKDNGLTYFAAYGTCLGAVRHHGFIPWDDDMDVFMMRTDYERLLTLREQLKDSTYWVSDLPDGNHPFPFAKFYSTDCSVWVLRQFPFVIGPWIDIFPLDEWEDNQEASKLHDDYHYALWKYRKSLSTQSWKEIGSDLIHQNGFNGLIKLVKKCFYSPFKSYYFNRAMRYIDRIRSFRGSKLKLWATIKGEAFEKEWFGQTIEIPFEDTTMMCPLLYDDVLKNMFGDYMTLPPIKERVGKHRLFYCDLNKVKNVQEILEELRAKGEISKNEGKPLSFKVLINEWIHRKGF